MDFGKHARKWPESAAIKVEQVGARHLVSRDDEDCSQLDDATANSDGDRVGAILGVQLFHDVADVSLHRFF